MDEMVIIGMDPHKASNTIAVLDSTENLLTRRRFALGGQHPIRILADRGEHLGPALTIHRADQQLRWGLSDPRCNWSGLTR